MSTILKQDEQPEGVPVCGGNMSTPVTDTTQYIDEIHYRIGERLYIENAD
jgi:hypothetical protein